jgi:hypothetical protein
VVITQTQPKPSLYVRIVVGNNDVVIGYLIVATQCVDDARLFGMEPEKVKYLREAQGKIKMARAPLTNPPSLNISLLELTRILSTGLASSRCPLTGRKL